MLRSPFFCINGIFSGMTNARKYMFMLLPFCYTMYEQYIFLVPRPEKAQHTLYFILIPFLTTFTTSLHLHQESRVASRRFSVRYNSALPFNINLYGSLKKKSLQIIIYRLTLFAIFTQYFSVACLLLIYC